MRAEGYAALKKTAHFGLLGSSDAPLIKYSVPGFSPDLSGFTPDLLVF